jgi:hypothetical protein
MGMPQEYRTRALENWGFNCSCSLCTASKKEQEASDNRRKRLPEIQYILNSQMDQLSYDDIVQLTEELLYIVDAERLIKDLGQYYQYFMQLYYNIRDLDSAIKYGEMALEHGHMFGDDPGAPMMKSLKGNVEILKTIRRGSSVR